MSDNIISNNFCPTLDVPDLCLKLYPGQRVKLSRFTNEVWTVCYGWYSWGGNRRVCGWYLINAQDQSVKPLQDTDLDDIYLIKY